MTISIERTILNTTLNGLEVIKCVEETKLPLENSQEFCISVNVVTDILSDSSYKRADGFTNAAFFGETYELANDEYITWLDKVVSDEDATYNKARGVQCLLNELKADY